MMAMRLHADACPRYSAMLMLRRFSQATGMRIHDYRRSQCSWGKLAQTEKNYRRNGPKALHLLEVVRGPSNLISVTRSWQTHPARAELFRRTRVFGPFTSR